MKNATSGNALWFVLLGLFLLGALTVFLSRSGGSVDQSGDVEQLRIMSSEIFRSATGIEEAIRQMQSRGVSENDISFDGGPSGYPDCGADDCKIFKSAGGGQTYKPPREIWLDSAAAAESLYSTWFIPSHVCVESVPSGSGCNTDGSGSSEDLVLILPWIRADLCKQINRDLNVDNPGGNPPMETGDAWSAGNVKFAGTFSDGSAIDDAGGALSGKRSGCFAGKSGSTPNGGYHYYQVLIAR
jgi:hypothetical protein